MKEVSIILPSLRETLAKIRIAEWKKTNNKTDYEIILVSPFEINEGKVVWMKDRPPFRGTIHAVNLASQFVEGEYIIYMSDDIIPTENCLENMLKFMKEQTIHPFLGAFKMIRDGGKEIGPFGAYNKLYACYGCISKEDLLSLSDILIRPKYKYSWGDIDLSLRIWEKGGEVKICDNATVIPHQVEDEIYREHREKYFNQDEETFLCYWHSKLGTDFKRKGSSVNRRLSANRNSNSDQK